MDVTVASILIVEDEELNRTLLERKLKEDGYNVTSCATGAAALALANREKFDLILLDIMLPDMNGVEILKSLKNNPDLLHTVVIMVTANDDRETVMQCIDIGAADYLAKPYSMLIVKSRIRHALNIGSSSKDEAMKSAKILLVDDQELNRDVLAHRLKKCGSEITCVSDGRSALQELESTLFDLILLDIMMPDISGIDVLKNIRKEGTNMETPVIMVTALDDMDTVNECMHAGADDYILKPLNTALLKIRVSSCL